MACVWLTNWYAKVRPTAVSSSKYRAREGIEPASLQVGNPETHSSRKGHWIKAFVDKKDLS